VSLPSTSELRRYTPQLTVATLHSLSLIRARGPRDLSTTGSEWRVRSGCGFPFDQPANTGISVNSDAAKRSLTIGSSGSTPAIHEAPRNAPDGSFAAQHPPHATGGHGRQTGKPTQNAL